MRAAYLTGHGDVDCLKVGDLPIPDVAPHLVRIKLKAVALNHLDIWVRKGLPGLALTFPHIPCSDGAGTVAALGAGVDQFRLGDEVIVFPGVSCNVCEACKTGWESLCSQYKILGEHINGTAAEYVVVPAANCFRKPKNLDWTEASSLGLVFVTAWQMVVRRAKVKEGQWVLIHAAASGVSSAAIQIARVFGARVIATASSAEKLKLAKSLGAAEAINYRDTDFAAEVKRITGGKGVDVVIDHVGESVWEKNIKSLKWGGVLVTCGASSGFKAVTDLRQLFYRQLSLLGSTMGSKQDFPAILRHFEKGDFRSVVDSVVPLEKIGEAEQLLEAHRALGKVCLRLD